MAIANKYVDDCNHNNYLGFLNCGIVSITHWTNIHAVLPFPITLTKELLHDQIHPVSIQIEWLCWI